MSVFVSMLFKFLLEGLPDLLWHAMSFNPFALGDFAEKRILKLVKQFSGHCRSSKSQNLPKSHLQVVHFVTFWSRCNILACEVQACAESKISS